MDVNPPQRPKTRERSRGRGRQCLFPESQPTSSQASQQSADLQETGETPVNILNHLLHALQESSVAGPQLFRLETEFCHSLGEGGQGNVRGLKPELEDKYGRTHERIRRIWPVQHIAIKQHLWRETKEQQAGRPPLSQEELCDRFRAAESEVLALAPELFRENPNIVQLLGWGLCLDTMEDSRSPCCGGLQLPLLVFERAEQDLAQFLVSLFPQAKRNDYSRAEQGLACLDDSGQILSPGHLASLSRWAGLTDWAMFGKDPYEVVRLLCIDVGHGLQSLHGHHFTHGDLKPENVLVFRTAERWTAKLCDFGCAVKQNHTPTSSDGAPQRPREMYYAGTDCWPPPRSERLSVKAFDDLRKIDIFVYGLLVWSSFCLRGKPPPRPERQIALENMDELSKAHVGPTLPFTSNRSWIFDHVQKLLKSTFNSRENRSRKPWSLLYRSDEAVPALEVPNSNASGTLGHHASTSALTNVSQFNLPDRQWKNQENGSRLRIEDGLGPHAAQISNIKSSHDECLPGPASTKELPSDDNCLSTAIYVGERRQSDARALGPAMVSLLDTRRGRDLAQIGETLYHCARFRLLDTRRGRDLAQSDEALLAQIDEALYHCARFRSRVQHNPQWWSLRHTSRDGNLVKLALEACPPVEINTLAWLCAGPIGKVEVEALDGDFEIWKSIMGKELGGRKAKLDESARLDRFLLLLQSGAHVERIIRNSPDQASGTEPDTIFSVYIKSCRAEIVPTVVSEVSKRLDRAKDEGRVSPSILKYFEEYKYSGTALEGREAEQADDVEEIARLTLMQCISDDTNSPLVADFDNATERDSLLYRHAGSEATMPHGWKAVANEQKRHGLSCYKDEFTRSVTLTRPQVSPIKMRQVKVGQLRNPNTDGLLCYVDLLSCMRILENKDEQLKLEVDLRDRFPYFDNAWYAEEWDKEPNTDDVLGRIWMPWRIRTFGQFLYTRTGREVTRGAILMVVTAVTTILGAYIVLGLLGKSSVALFCISAVALTILGTMVRLVRIKFRSPSIRMWR